MPIMSHITNVQTIRFHPTCHPSMMLQLEGFSHLHSVMLADIMQRCFCGIWMATGDWKCCPVAIPNVLPSAFSFKIMLGSFVMLHRPCFRQMEMFFQSLECK